MNIEDLNNEILNVEQSIKVREMLNRKKDQAYYLYTNKSKEIRNYEAKLKEEQKDVDRLKNFTLQRIFSNLSGKLDEKLEKEEQELYTCKVTLDSLLEELNELEIDYNQYKGQISEFRSLDSDLKMLLQKKEQLLRDSSPELKEQIDECNRVIRLSNEQIFEIDQALRAGYQLKSTISVARNKLKEAERYATMDIWTDSYLIKQARRNRQLDANQYITVIRSKVEVFKRECKDIKQNVGYIVIPTAFTLSSVEFFFNGWFEWSARSNIREALAKVTSMSSKISNQVQKIEKLRRIHEDNIRDNKQRISRIIRDH